LPDGHKLDQMAIKYTNIFHRNTLQNCYFWFENEPSGNPGFQFVEGFSRKKWKTNRLGASLFIRTKLWQAAVSQPCLCKNSKHKLFSSATYSIFCFLFILFCGQFNFAKAFWEDPIQEPILRLLNLQLQRQRCSRLERFQSRKQSFLF
jgi:hypothetical protein